ncbi:MAG: hypothetical protein AB7K24_26585 [Gemmataceae bacterium]
MPKYQIKPSGNGDVRPCDCCGLDSLTVWGLVYRHEAAHAAYYVHWTPGRLEHGARFDLVLGDWTDDAQVKERTAVSLQYRLYPNGPEFSVIDSGERRIADRAVIGRFMLRKEVLGQPIADDVFQIVDAIWLQDRRISELAGEPDG